MATAYVATVHLLMKVEGEGEAAYAISGLLTDGGIYEEGSGVLDWSYQRDGVGEYAHGRPVEIPDNYDRDEADLDAIARSVGPGAEMRAKLLLVRSALLEIAQTTGLGRSTDGLEEFSEGGVGHEALLAVEEMLGRREATKFLSR